MTLTTPTRTLYRPATPTQLAAIADRSWRAFSLDHSGQDAFYPMRHEAYADLIARLWNAPHCGAGYVLRFRVHAACLQGFPCRTVATEVHREYRVPADRLEHFNRHIVGTIGVITRYTGRRSAPAARPTPTRPTPAPMALDWALPAGT